MSVDQRPPSSLEPQILSIHPIYTCKACGAETPVPATSAALEACPYCGGKKFKIR